MGKEMPGSFYTGKGYMKEGMFKVYEPLYKEVSSLLPPPKKCPKILDLGCGVGFFAKVVQSMGYTDYLGLDFSENILKLARENTPKVEYILANLHSKETKKIISKNKMFILLETLEHIEKDIQIINTIPKGSIIIASVPNRMSAGHVRVFSGIVDVVNRYENVINFNFMKTITLSPKKKSVVTIFRGEKK